MKDLLSAWYLGGSKYHTFESSGALIQICSKCKDQLLTSNANNPIAPSRRKLENVYATTISTTDKKCCMNDRAYASEPLLIPRNRFNGDEIVGSMLSSFSVALFDSTNG